MSENMNASFDLKELKKNDNINSRVELTLLDSRATAMDIEKLSDIAYKNQYYGVCVNSANVLHARTYIQKNFESSLKVVSVVGFPLGANLTNVKVMETSQAILNGADEVDVVINIGKAKEGDFAYVKNELSKIKKAAKRHVVKAILETCYFDETEIIKLCRLCIKANIDFVKTSTGFGTGGANPNIVSIMHREVAGKCGLKASGGIRTREQAVELINLGADRIGTSHLI